MKVIQALEGGVLARPVVGKMELGWRGQDAVNDKMTIPAGKLTEALDIYAATVKKSDVREFLFPKRWVGRLNRAEPLCQPSEFPDPAVQ